MILCSNPSEQFKSYQSEIEEAVIAVMRSNRYVLGKEVDVVGGAIAQNITFQESYYRERMPITFCPP